MATSTESSKHPSGYLVTPRVPQGLAAAVEGLTREVLRHRPEDIYVFAAHHFEKLLKIRQQCETSDNPRETGSRTLRDMGMRHLTSLENEKESARTRDSAEKNGWSVNQTAKVLKRHRNIVGDSGCSEKAFVMINDAIKKSGSSRMFSDTHRSSSSSRHNESFEDFRKSSKRISERSWSTEEHSTGDFELRNTPKIISRMPSTGMLAKDIKTELRKNRISSRERRSTKEKPEERRRIERFETVEKMEIVKRSSTRKSLDRSKKSEDNEQVHRKRKENNAESSGCRIKKMSSMDQVKDYVVHKFATSKSIEELQSINYVEKVQRIIDETSPIIKEKVEELKNGFYRKSRSKYKNSESEIELNKSGDNNELEERLNETENVLKNVSASLNKSNRRSRSARGLRRMHSVSKISSDDVEIENPQKHEELMVSALLIENGRKDGLEMRLNETKNILEDISSGFSKPKRRSQSAKGSCSNLVDCGNQKSEELETMLNETRNLLAGISSSFPNQNGFKLSRGSGNASSSSKSDESDQAESQNISKVSLPAVRAPSSKGKNKNLVKSDSEDFILPAISPETTKSTKRKEEFSLPVLSPSGTSSAEDTKMPNSDDVFSKEIDTSEVAVEEVFKDSLNGTPEPFEIPPRPDSLEPELLNDLENPTNNNNHIKEKLIEIQEVEKNIEKVFNQEQIDIKSSPHILKEQLKELLEVEKGIAEILDSNELVKNSDQTQIGIEPDHVKEKLDEKNSNLLDNEKTVEEENKKILLSENHKIENTSENILATTPEEFSNTYILTEGSPYEIPETVTTVIIPDCPLSPDSDRLNVEFDNENSEAVRLTFLGVENLTIVEVDEPISIPYDSVNVHGKVIFPNDFIEPSIELPLPRTEVIINKLDLQSINEEETILEEEINEKEYQETPKSTEDNEAVENLKSTSQLDTLDISAGFTGQENISTTSTSAKETTVTDNEIENSKKFENPGEVEEASSECVSAESTNEAKETTATDGTSLSIDPMRPFVPELNLDSLQDITVSSFKMTEDDYEDPGENENTNSITETLTPDENLKVTSEEKEEEQNLSEFCEIEKIIMETEVTESEEIPSNESNEVEEIEEKSLEVQEIIEKPFVKEFVEIKEPPCEKKIIYNTEPNTTDTEKDSENFIVHSELEKELENSELDPELKFNDNDEKKIPNSLNKESESDECLEETEDNFVDEDPPLAVSRSASQCTTRRVSSGNLARLKEELRLDENEEIEINNEKLTEYLVSPKDKILPQIEIKKEDSFDDVTVDKHENSLEKSKEYHIYVLELDQSDESTTESSFNSAATKIQAGVRGFLTRRRLHRMHHLNSTLNSVPSIQDSIVIDENPVILIKQSALELEDAAKMIQSSFRGYKARQRFHREDAMQRTTISMERAFAEDGICHTGEFHDCIPLPFFDLIKKNEKLISKEFLIEESKQEENNDNLSEKSSSNGVNKNESNQENLKIKNGLMFGFQSSVPELQLGINPTLTRLVDVVVLAQDESAVQSGYLNFITSVEDTEDVPTAPNSFFVSNSSIGVEIDVPRSDLSGESMLESIELSPRKGVIIEEITSLEEANIIKENLLLAKESKINNKIQSNENIDELSEMDNQSKNQDNNKLENIIETNVDFVSSSLVAPLATLGIQMQEGKLMRYGSEDFTVFRERRPLIEVTLTPGDPMKSLSLSQESQLAGERIESPITMMQIVPVRSESFQRDDSSEIASNDGKIESISTNSTSTEDATKILETEHEKKKDSSQT